MSSAGKDKMLSIAPRFGILPNFNSIVVVSSKFGSEYGAMHSALRICNPFYGCKLTHHRRPCNMCVHALIADRMFSSGAGLRCAMPYHLCPKPLCVVPYPAALG